MRVRRQVRLDVCLGEREGPSLVRVDHRHLCLAGAGVDGALGDVHGLEHHEKVEVRVPLVVVDQRDEHRLLRLVRLKHDLSCACFERCALLGGAFQRAVRHPSGGVCLSGAKNGDLGLAVGLRKRVRRSLPVEHRVRRHVEGLLDGGLEGVETVRLLLLVCLDLGLEVLLLARAHAPVLVQRTRCHVRGDPPIVQVRVLLPAAGACDAGEALLLLVVARRALDVRELPGRCLHLAVAVAVGVLGGGEGGAAGLVGVVGVDLGAAKPVAVGGVHPRDQPGHEQECDHSLAKVDHVRRDPDEHDRHPEVREERVERRDQVHREPLHPPHLARR
mmetsp:Transcript_22234/g.45388  ORF Transcript_22234/g.45388 Transcript_22234/m.45388 type:complete len:331 (+) Transcript_22234:1217-2209(+)